MDPCPTYFHEKAVIEGETHREPFMMKRAESIAMHPVLITGKETRCNKAERKEWINFSHRNLLGKL